MQPCAWHQDDRTMADSRLGSSFCLPCTFWQFVNTSISIGHYWSIMNVLSTISNIIMPGMHFLNLCWWRKRNIYIVQCIFIKQQNISRALLLPFGGYWNALVEFLSLKLLDLYLYTLIISILIIGNKSCNMLSIVNKLTLQKQLQNVVTHYAVLHKKSINTTTNPCRRRELNPGTFPPKADVSPLHHRVNWEYGL